MKTIFQIPDRFPPTLTLSPAEREQPLHILFQSESRGAEGGGGFAKTLGAFLPLPEGEGRGEGKRRVTPA